MKSLVSHEHTCPNCKTRLAYVPPLDVFEDPAKKEADALALWAVRMLDAWADADQAGRSWQLFRQSISPGYSTSLCLKDWQGKVLRTFHGSPDAARIAAANAVCAELGDACPKS